MKTKMTEKEADAILRENLIDARYMQQEYELEGNEELSWYYYQEAFALRKLLMYGTLKEKLKIANP